MILASMQNFTHQLILYSLPVLLSLTTIGAIEGRYQQKDFASVHAFAWKGCFFPLLISLLFARAVIIALPQALKQNLTHAWLRFLLHGGLALLGFALYAWSLAHQPETGLPPLHLWWAKVLMYFNLCMMVLHILPLPNMIMGEWLRQHRPAWFRWQEHSLWLWLFLAASPLLDACLGVYLIYPIYGSLASWAL